MKDREGDRGCADDSFDTRAVMPYHPANGHTHMCAQTVPKHKQAVKDKASAGLDAVYSAVRVVTLGRASSGLVKLWAGRPTAMLHTLLSDINSHLTRLATLAPSPLAFSSHLLASSPPLA